MSVSLNKILQNALEPVQYDEKKVTKYKWIISKKDGGIQYVDASTKGNSIEKVYQLMNQELNAFKNSTTISKEQSMQLEELKRRANNLKDEYKNKHSSFFGKIYLILKGIFNGGHINKLSRKLTHTIDLLLKKPLTPNIEDLDTFLSLVSPKTNDLDISLRPGVWGRKWVYDSDTKVVQDIECELSYDHGQDPAAMQTILEVMNSQLGEFDTLNEITAAQKLQIENLNALVANRAPEQTPIQMAVLEKITRLYSLPISEIESEEMIQKMQRNKEQVYHELLNSEKSFLQAIEHSIVILARLNDIKSKINYSSRYKPFFYENIDEDTKKASLENCIEAFKILKNHTENLILGIEQLIDSEERDQELDKLYQSELFSAYAKQMSVCARYYEFLCNFEKDLKSKNKPDGAIHVHFTDSENKAIDPTSYYITVVQRLPRHQMLMFELTKNTPGHFNQYRSVYAAYIQALSFSTNMNKRMNYPFTV